VVGEHQPEMADPPGDGGDGDRIGRRTAPALRVDVPPAGGVRAERPAIRGGVPEVLGVPEAIEPGTGTAPDLVEDRGDRATDTAHEVNPISAPPGGVPVQPV